VAAVVAGEVQLMFTSLGSAMPHVRVGRLKALAVTSAQPSPLLPEMPAIAASVPGYESETIYAVFAPAKTPPEIVARLSREVAQAVKRPDINEKFVNAAVSTIGSTPAQLLATMKSEVARMQKVIRDANIRE
jgi:tripartite-type tricarboxylate transporter receptor subunit TctC